MKQVPASTFSPRFDILGLLVASPEAVPGFAA